MPLPLPKHRPDRPRRRVEPLAPPLRELPQRTYGFDPDAARQAWRQVARTRGAYAMRLDGRDPGSKLAPLALGLVALAAALLWWSTRDEAEPVEPTTEVAAVVVEGSEPGDAFDRPGLAPEPEPTSPPLPAGALSFGDASEPDEPPQPHVSRTLSLVPPGTPEDHAKALLKLPHAASDRPPLGGIGPEGMHVDRIAMGTGYDDNACTGPAGKFSVRDDDFANLCFRVVHPREVQKVVVRWERDGELVRRTFVTIGVSHGYRTRAVLPLRRRYRGEWVARIMSVDGVELASQAFQVQ